MIKLGDRITVKPATFDVPGKDGKPKAIPGTVVYVHPAGRYCVLEFDVGRREPVTIVEQHPWVTDVEVELARLRKEKEEAMEQAQEYAGAFQTGNQNQGDDGGGE